MKTTDWHAPRVLLFDSETLFDWLGVSLPEHVPPTFLADDVRAWKNDETSSDWGEACTIRDEQPGDITRYVRSLGQQRNAKATPE